jgi:ectoine hydroxylase-related dioxygenase (phytanoyl-CoA dioxygenase family)
MPATVKTFLASAEAHDVLQTLKADGVAIIKSAAQPETIDAVLKETGTLPEGQSFGLAAKSPTFVKELMMNKIYHDLVKRILTDTCIIFYEAERTVSTAEPQLSLTATLTSTPGSTGWGLRRQDDCHHTVHPAKRETDFGISFAATPITRSNGALRVVVGSNQWKDSRDPKEKEEFIVELAKGDAILQ